MSSCSCSLAGTAACQNCANNPYATAADGVMAVVSHLRTYVEPQTNADRIRSMTDEELADEFAKIEGDPYNGATIGFWLDWLREEVTDG